VQQGAWRKHGCPIRSAPIMYTAAIVPFDRS
jgi:hypothetical protein